MGLKIIENPGKMKIRTRLVIFWQIQKNHETGKDFDFSQIFAEFSRLPIDEIVENLGKIKILTRLVILGNIEKINMPTVPKNSTRFVVRSPEKAADRPPNKTRFEARRSPKTADRPQK